MINRQVSIDRVSKQRERNYRHKGLVSSWLVMSALGFKTLNAVIVGWIDVSFYGWGICGC